MAYSFTRGLAAAMAGYNQAQDYNIAQAERLRQEERQKKADAAVEERLVYERADRADKMAERDNIDRQKADVLRDVKKDINYDAATGYINKAQDEIYANGPVQNAPAPAFASVSDASKSFAAQQADLAKMTKLAGRSPTALAAAIQARRNLELDANTKALEESIKDPANFQRLVSGIAADTRNGYEAIQDANGVTHLAKSKDAIPYTPEETRKLMLYQFRKSQGDTKAQDVIDAIHDGYEKRIDKSLDVAGKITTSNNSADNRANSIEMSRQKLENQGLRNEIQAEARASRIDERKMLPYKNAQSALKELEIERRSILKDSAGDPTNPALLAVDGAISKARKNVFVAQINATRSDPDVARQIAVRTLNAAKTNAEINMSLSKLAEDIDPDFADEVARLIINSEQYARLSNKGAK